MHAHKEISPMRLRAQFTASPRIMPLTRAGQPLAAHDELQPGRRELFRLQAALQQARDEDQEYSCRYDELEQELDTVTCKSRARLIVRQLNLLNSQREVIAQRMGALNKKVCRLFACLNATRLQAWPQRVAPWEYGLAALQYPAA